MPLKWQSKPKYDGEPADEWSLTGQFRPLASVDSQTPESPVRVRKPPPGPSVRSLAY
ncbi:hypothetical protein C7401_11933 [Paraburkholderia unamae]|nr:hypothetical protein C7401_11933 [Paraburkholderia unamae]